jgi:hypothetical protein
VFELPMTALHSDLFPTTFLQKLYYGVDFHPAVLASAAWVGYRPLSPILVGDVLFGPPANSHNVLVKRRVRSTRPVKPAFWRNALKRFVMCIHRE